MVFIVSDRVSRHESCDRTGPALVDYLQSLSEYQICLTAVVSDDPADIRSRLKTWADQSNMNLILTTGGTGFGVRDNTPEVSLYL